jgi:uncharacterized membrane protein
MSSLVETMRKLLTGNVGSSSHPIHPSTVHFPIAFLSLSFAFDTLTGLTRGGYLPSSLNAWGHEHISDFAFSSYGLNVLGLITAIPATITGAAELLSMIQAKGYFRRVEKDAMVLDNGINPRVKLGIAHALLNDVTLVVAVWNWYSRRSVPGYAPSALNVILSTAMIPTLLFSAFLGGSMVYKYGVGVQRMGEAADIKADEAQMETKRIEGHSIVVEKKQL